MSKRIDQKIQALKIKMSVEKELNTIFGYFMDELAEDDEFIRMGEHTENELLHKTIEFVAAQLLKKEHVTASHILFKRLRKQKFVHGPCFIEGNMVTFFYFQDLDAGMMVLCHPRSYKTEYVRFSTQMLGQLPHTQQN